MRFSGDAYEKLYPRQEEVETVETAVETFKPTEEEQSAVENAETQETVEAQETAETQEAGE